ncbi:MAG: DUF2161 family putative PD-(D/E)XK-type phosphodiesterase [Myxococcota bacterium]|nr:DUF2161 family putative PD-(D/E)XK-type phosphodiesterase [Myxococcota bacterium]
MGKPKETALYPPVKAFLEAQGFQVKGEVGPADVVALDAQGEPLIVELKTGFSLTLLQQAVARQAITDRVYVAVPRWSGKAGWRAFKGNVGLCKRLGVGVLSVKLDDGTVKVHSEPTGFVPRKSKVKRRRLLSEFKRREGDPNLGGTRGPVTTAYKQEIERLRDYLREHGPTKGSVVAQATGVKYATRMLRDNHAGCFEKVERGVYRLVED